MTMLLKVFNTETYEIAAIMPVTDRALAEKLQKTLRRNDMHQGRRGASGWAVLEIIEEDDDGAE